MFTKITKSSTAFLFLVLSAMLFTACDPPVGYGGQAAIEGKLITKYYNADFSILQKEEAAVDEELFISFGNSEFFSDKVVTGATGAFQFPYLQDGDYAVYYKSKDSLSTLGEKETVMVEVTIEGGKAFDMGTVYQLETLDYNEGHASIKGRLRLVNYKNSSMYPFLEVKDTTWAQDQEVYLLCGDQDYYSERIRTSYDGTFRFDNLLKGEYTVFAYSEDLTGGTEDIPIIRNVSLTETSQEVDLGVILIKQL